MKKNTNKKTTKKCKNNYSPSSKKHKTNFNKNLIKDLDLNKLAHSLKKSQDKLLITQNKILSNKYHRRIKSNSDNYIGNITSFEINSPREEINYTKRKKRNEKDKEMGKKSYKKKTVSRNKKIKKSNQNNILYISSSLKDFKSNAFISYRFNSNINPDKDIYKYNKRYYNIENNLKTNKSVVFFDNTSNIEETRNTTSININYLNNINNPNLFCNNTSLNKKENDQKIKKYIKINRKHDRINSSMDNLIISNTNLNNKIIKEQCNPKYNLHGFIFRNNNINSKNVTNKQYLNSSKKSLRNSFNNFEKMKKSQKLNFQNSVSETQYTDNRDLNYSKTKRNLNISIKNYFPSSTRNIKSKIFFFPKYKKRANKSQEKYWKLKLNEDKPKKEFQFDNVEEIHFKFVELNQRKKDFFKKYEELSKL